MHEYYKIKKILVKNEILLKSVREEKKNKQKELEQKRLQNL